ncbi:MAG: ABC transporter transmembrane domain-containing protein [Saprospiraceae bacterium]|nr:ABC transporter transmembrane domain-containing protein [Saprospiraceae bacterium]MDW8228565.1 ABC transporter transmembrane domain-containing protein [Saprospiraceae bacterium]
MLRLLRYFRPYKRLLLLAVVSNLLMSLFLVVSIPVLQPFLQILFDLPGKAAAPPALQAATGFRALEQAVSGYFADLVRTQGRERALLWVCGLLVFTFLGKNLFRYLSLYFLAPVRNGVVRDLRNRLVVKILELPLSYFSEARKGDLMSRASADVQEVDSSIIGVVESVAREPIIILGSLAFMLYVSPTLLGFALLLMLFSGLVIGRIGLALRRQSREAQGNLGMVSAVLEETLGGLRIIKGFNAQRWQQARYERENARYAALLTRIGRRRDLASPLSEFLGIVAVAVILWFGARQVFSGEMTAPTFITFLYAFYNIIEPAKRLSAASYSIRKGLGALERVEALLAEPVSIRDQEDAQPVQAFREGIEFQRVSFRYPNAETDALRDISLAIPKGKVVALVGASGAGKSTLADLLPRFYDVTEGRILLDGVDIRRLRIRDLRALMGIVSQEAILFNDTVRNNIAFGLEGVSDADIEAAARAAHAHEFITALPHGYDTNIGERGTKLSGGQRQRLTIARALLRNPPILILDEATSALDSESEKVVQAALNRLLQNRTALVIAHRLSTVQHADEIIVLDQGRIVQRGKHESLLQQGGIYQNLVALQAL